MFVGIIGKILGILGLGLLRVSAQINYVTSKYFNLKVVLITNKTQASALKWVSKKWFVIALVSMTLHLGSTVYTACVYLFWMHDMIMSW